MISNYPDIQDLTYVDDGMLIAGSNLIEPLKAPKPCHHLPIPECEDCMGIYLRQNNQIRKLDVPELNYRQILEVGGIYYFASDNGVVVWDGIKVINVITEDDGLTDNQTCALVMDKHGFLWVSTFSGLNRINLLTGKITQYLKNIEFNYRSVFQNDSLVYMGSVQGVFKFSPTTFLGDDIEPAPLWSAKQILILLGLVMTLLFSAILYFVSRHNRRKLKLKSTQIQEMEHRLFLMQIDQVVFNMDIAITVTNLAEALDMSDSTLYRTFKAYNLKPGAYLKELKLKKAKYLLKSDPGHYTMKKIAQKIGYTEQYLARLLKTDD